ncbi:hypothetical protein BOC57_26405 [Burkholderia pseudomallei]|nr:hypothetical protein BOC57_26405 [Burkholderia pseudomallei]
MCSGSAKRDAGTGTGTGTGTGAGAGAGDGDGDGDGDATGGETLVRALRLPCVRGVHTARGFASVSTNRRARIRRPMMDGFKRISRRGSRKSA